MQIANFEEEDLMPLYRAFISAFSDYFVRFAPSAQDFETRIVHKLNIHHHLSKLAWNDGQVVGFVLHTLGTYHGKTTLYNGGTGVIPAYHRKQVATRLYQELIEQLPETSEIEQIVLEVVDQNKAGIKFYEQLGFRYAQTFKCFKLTNKLPDPALEGITIAPASQWAAYDHLFSFSPSFLDTSTQLVSNQKHETILEARYSDQVVGVAVFQAHLGRISQLAVSEAWRGRGIGRALCGAVQKLSTNKSLTVMNITEEAYDFIEALEAIGFVNEINQFELELII